MKEINPKIRFTKIRDVKSPCRANKHDAGSDFYIPNATPEFSKVLSELNPRLLITYRTEKCENGDLKDSMELRIRPHDKIKIPSGIKVDILDKMTYLDVSNKSGIATEKGITFLAEVIDAGYQGEVFFSLLNTTDSFQVLKTGTKMVQVVQKEYVPTEWEEISNEEYSEIEVSDRGAGSEGSSGAE